MSSFKLHMVLYDVCGSCPVAQTRTLTETGRTQTQVHWTFFSNQDISIRKQTQMATMKLLT